jgi:hypothetical protein
VGEEREKFIRSATEDAPDVEAHKKLGATEGSEAPDREADEADEPDVEAHKFHS